MKYDPNIHHRHSIRLIDFDYSKNESYFFTICVWKRNISFGQAENQLIRLNPFGFIVEQTWLDLCNHNEDIILGSYVVMPTHFHGVVSLSNFEGNRKIVTLPEIIWQLKTYSSRRINELRNASGVPVWQRGYYERIIRDQQEMEQVNKYIKDNPRNWHEKDYFVEFPEPD